MSESAEKYPFYLKNMAKFAAIRRAEVEVAELADRYRYIRVGGQGYRAVSLEDRQPCGSLVDPLIGRPILGGRKHISRAIEDCDNAAGEPNGAKSEHRIQAFLIRNALRRPDDFASLLGCGDVFDRLAFVTDELSLGHLRGDIVALGTRDGVHRPVFIELKISRDHKTLKKQLAGISSALNDAGSPLRGPFTELLAAATGASVTQKNLGPPVCILVWPPSASGKEALKVSEWRNEDSGNLTVCWEKVSGDSIDFRFWKTQ